MAYSDGYTGSCNNKKSRKQLCGIFVLKSGAMCPGCSFDNSRTATIHFHSGQNGDSIVPSDLSSSMVMSVETK